MVSVHRRIPPNTREIAPVALPVALPTVKAGFVYTTTPPHRKTLVMPTTVDKSAETLRLRNELCDRRDVHPVRDWSPGFIKAVIGRCDCFRPIAGKLASYAVSSR